MPARPISRSRPAAGQQGPDDGLSATGVRKSVQWTDLSVERRERASGRAAASLAAVDALKPGLPIRERRLRP